MSGFATLSASPYHPIRISTRMVDIDSKGVRVNFSLDLSLRQAYGGVILLFEMLSFSVALRCTPIHRVVEQLGAIAMHATGRIAQREMICRTVNENCTS